MTGIGLVPKIPGLLSEPVMRWLVGSGRAKSSKSSVPKGCDASRQEDDRVIGLEWCCVSEEATRSQYRRRFGTKVEIPISKRFCGAPLIQAGALWPLDLTGAGPNPEAPSRYRDWPLSSYWPVEKDQAWQALKQDQLRERADLRATHREEYAALSRQHAAERLGISEQHRSQQLQHDANRVAARFSRHPGMAAQQRAAVQAVRLRHHAGLHGNAPGPAEAA